MTFIKKILLITTVSLSTLLSAQNTYSEYTPQKFFSSSDLDTFMTLETRELLKKIIVDGKEYYMQQDGDLFEEDVAIIEDVIFSAKGSLFSFGRSKRLLALEVYPSHQKAFYSNCDYKIKEKKLVPIHKTCGFTYRKNKNRS
jgi:hypothetical protein